MIFFADDINVVKSRCPNLADCVPIRMCPTTATLSSSRTTSDRVPANDRHRLLVTPTRQRCTLPPTKETISRHQEKPEDHQILRRYSKIMLLAFVSLQTKVDVTLKNIVFFRLSVYPSVCLRVCLCVLSAWHGYHIL